MSDGRSLEPVLHGSVTSWRSAVLLEAAANYSPPYRGIRTISTGGSPSASTSSTQADARELYDLDPDPHERTNHVCPIVTRRQVRSQHVCRH